MTSGMIGNTLKSSNGKAWMSNFRPLKPLKKIKKGSTNAMILFLSSSSIISNALNIISGLFVAKWLLPEELGSFNTFTIFTGYIILIQAGIPSALSRELPYYLGSGEKEMALRYTSVSQYWQKTLANVCLLIGFLISGFFLWEGNYQYAAGSIVVGFLVWQGLYVTKYLKILYRTNKDFNKLSWINLINAGVAFSGIFFVYLYGFYGLCIRAVLGVVVDFVITYRWRPIKVKAEWNKSSFMDLMKLGLPMFGVASIYGLWPLLQRTLVLTLGGTRSLGLFALAIMVQTSMNTVSASLSSVMYPTMTTAWGKGEKLKTIFMELLKPFGVAFIVFLLLIPVGWWLLPIFVREFLPNYLGGVPAGQWMLIVGLFSLTNVFSNVYNIVKDQRKRFLNYISGVISWAITVYLLYFFQGFSLDIYPKGMVAAFVVMGIINFFYIKKRLHFNHRWEC